MYVQNITFRAGILEQSLGARNRVGIGLWFRLHRLAGLTTTRFLLGSYCPHKLFKIPALHKKVGRLAERKIDSICNYLRKEGAREKGRVAISRVQVAISC